MVALRKLRDEWENLNPYGVEYNALIAHGSRALAESERVRKVVENQQRG